MCRSPVQAKKSRQQRKELLEKTEEALQQVVTAVECDCRPVRGIAAISMCAGQALGRFKMKKHVDFKISDDHFSYSLNKASIQSAEALDGLYVIRTSLKEKPRAAEVARHYKRLAKVEWAFRALKSVSLKVHPIHHRRKDRVICHVLLCMLAYYVENHLRKQLAPQLLADEDPVQRENAVKRCRLRRKRRSAASARLTATGR